MTCVSTDSRLGVGSGGRGPAPVIGLLCASADKPHTACQAGVVVELWIRSRAGSDRMLLLKNVLLNTFEDFRLCACIDASQANGVEKRGPSTRNFKKSGGGGGL